MRVNTRLAMALVVAHVVAILLPHSAWGQDVNTNIPVSGAFQYDMVADEAGIHLAVHNGNEIRYYFLDEDINIVKDVLVRSGSGVEEAAMTIHEDNSGRRLLHIAFREGNEIKIYQSEGGDTWTPLASRTMQNSGSMTRADAVGEGDIVFLTWDAGGQIFFNYYRFGGTPPGWQLLPDKERVTDPNLPTGPGKQGKSPAISRSRSGGTTRLHITWDGDVDDEGFEDISNRDFNLTQGQWSSPESVYGPTVASALSAVANEVHGNELWAFSLQAEDSGKDPYWYQAFHGPVDNRTSFKNPKTSTAAQGPDNSYADYNSDPFGGYLWLVFSKSPAGAGAAPIPQPDIFLTYWDPEGGNPDWNFVPEVDIGDGNYPLISSNSLFETVVTYVSNGEIHVQVTPRQAIYSVSSSATAASNGRRLVVDAGGNYHLIYESDGVIMYRRYNVSLNPPAWDRLAILSSGGYSHLYPSIAARSGKLYVVWQEQTGSSSYDIYFATSQDGGGTWAPAYVLATTEFQQPTDPLPVVAASVSGDDLLMVNFRDGNPWSPGVTSLRTTKANPAPADWIKQHVPGTDAADLYPALAAARHYYGTSANFGLAYATTGGEIYYQYYESTAGGWSGSPTNLSAIVPGSNAVHKTPSLTGIGTGSTSFHVAWYRREGDGSSIYDHTIIHRKSNGFDSWPNEYSQTYYGDQWRPSLTALAWNKVDLLYQEVSGERVVKMRYDGYNWGGPSVVDWGRYPSVSTGSTTAKYVWTSQSGPPYEVLLSSETLTKSVPVGEPTYSRRFAWLDSSGAYLLVRLKRIAVKSSDGREEDLPFARPELDSVEITPARTSEFLASVPVFLPSWAESLLVDLTFSGEALEKAAEAPGAATRIEVEVRSSEGLVLASIPGSEVPRSGSIAETADRISCSFAALGIGPESGQVMVRLKIHGFDPRPGTYASLGHIYELPKSTAKVSKQVQTLEEEATSTGPEYLAVYPNPFNPQTTIRYLLPWGGKVRLRIMNVLGQAVRTLVDGLQERGQHAVVWDGRSDSGRLLPSGMYMVDMQVTGAIGRALVKRHKLLLMR